MLAGELRRFDCDRNSQCSLTKYSLPLSSERLSRHTPHQKHHTKKKFQPLIEIRL